MLPKVSIITPSYNQGQFISATIESVMAQGYTNLEHIVMDGGSKDNTLEVLKAYPHLVVRSERDKGQSDAVNKGVALATGEIIGWLNSDDTYLPGAVTAAVEALQNADVVYGNCQFIDAQGKYMAHFRTRSFDYEALTRWDFFAQPTVFFRRQAFIEVGGVDLRYRCTMDYELWLRLTRNRRVVYLDQDLATYRIHEAAKTTKDFSRMALESYQVRQKYGLGFGINAMMFGKEIAGGLLRTTKLGTKLTMATKRLVS